MQWWHLAAGANTVVALAYFGISAAVLVPLMDAGQLRSNRLGLATALIFFSCAVGHGGHAVHLLSPLVGIDVVHGELVQASTDWHLAVWTALTACVGLWYWSLRRSYGRLLDGAKLFEDQRARQREAAEINDAVVQGIVTAQLARRLGRHDEADAALEDTLASARELVSRLLDEASGGKAQDAGDFVRRAAATVGGPSKAAAAAPAPRRPDATDSPDRAET